MVAHVLAIGLISPGFLVAGAALAAVPIIIHILNRRRFKIVQWAAMNFLLNAMKKNRRRLRFEQLLLLATRCAVLLLVGLALSRPLGCAQNSLAGLAGRRSGVTVIVIDNAFSMGYQANRPNARTQLDQAKLVAKELIDRLSSGGESVAIVTTARPATAVLPRPIYNLHDAEAAVDRIEQSCRGDDEAGALTLAANIARDDSSEPNKTLELIDDNTRACWESSADSIQQVAHDLPELFKQGIEHYALGRADEWNDAVVEFHPAERLVTTRFAADFVADVRGYGEQAGQASLTCKVDDLPIGAGATAVKPDAQPGVQTVTASNLSAGRHIFSAVLSSDDHLPLDNIRYRAVNVIDKLKVLIVEGEQGVGGLGSSGAFLDTALNPPIHDGPPSYAQTERISDFELPGKVLTDYRVVCLCGVGQIQESEAAQLEKFVRQGGALLIFMGDKVTAENYNATLYKHHLLPGPLTRRITAGSDQQARLFDFNPRAPLNPILADFQNQQNTGMDTAQIYSYWQMDLPPNTKAQRVLNFLPADRSRGGPEDPAITLQSLGAGKVVFYATSADPNSEWTTFMAHSAYPALMHMLVLGTASSGDEWMNVTVEQPVVLPATLQMTSNPILTDASQKQYPMEQALDADGQPVYRAAPLPRPGVYTLSTGVDTYRIAVNLAPDVSDVRTINDSELQKILGIEVALRGDTAPQDVAQGDEPKDMGWSVMTIVAALLAVECLMAMKFGHHRRVHA